jgi:regulator of protease activity HflC (stomatin/prohibitin superfamily)
MWIFLGFVCIAALVGISVWKRTHNAKVEAKIANSNEKDESRIRAFRLQNQFPVPNGVGIGIIALSLFSFGLGLWDSVMFYAEPGYVYHVRTITGDEKAVGLTDADVGWNTHWFSSHRITPWKREMSLVAKADYDGQMEDDTATLDDDAVAEAAMGPVRAIFLDQVDADISATARFRLPTDEESFLEIARAYRSPANLVRTTLTPAFRETIQANSALMGAEEYFNGSRNQFNIDYQDQLENGLFITRRVEVQSERVGSAAQGSANASLGPDQEEFGDTEKLVLEVEKLTNEQGVALRKVQSYTELGIVVVEARITDVVPNQAFAQRMVLKQQAAADRAIAREQRIQEEEQRLLAEARGEREVAERRASALVEQIQQTTEAETTKQLALTAATQQKEQAEIDRETSAIRLEQARIDAERQTTLADAAAYEREALINADNALQQKLDAETEIQRVWAEAFARRAVPQTVFVTGGGEAGNGSTPTGSNTELANMVQLMTMQMARQLDYDRTVAKPGK